MLAVQLSISEHDAPVVVALRGDLDVTGVPDTEPAITALMARGQRLAWCSGGDVILAAPQSYARRLLALTGQGGTFWVQPSVAAAVAGTPGDQRRYAWRRRPVSTARPGRAAPSPTCTG